MQWRGAGATDSRGSEFTTQLLPWCSSCGGSPECAFPTHGLTADEFPAIGISDGHRTFNKPGLWRVDQANGTASNNPSALDINMAVCITPAMIARSSIPLTGQLGQASCVPTVAMHNASTTVYTSQCLAQGVHISEMMRVLDDGNSMIVNVNALLPPGSSTSPQTLHLHARLLYLGPDCHGTYPVPQVAQ
jgi:hypothetical protein